MAIRARFSTISPARLVHLAGGALVLGGVLFWGLRLWQLPARHSAPQSVQTVAANPTAEAVARWLGPGDVRLNVVVQGVLIRRDRAVAILSINDGAPQAFMRGETVMENVSVRTIAADGVVLDNAGKPLHFPSPISPQFPEDGIVRAAIRP